MCQSTDSTCPFTALELPKLCYKEPHFDVRNDSGAEACTLPFTGDFDEDAYHGFLRPRRGNAFLVGSSETIDHPIRRGAGLRVGSPSEVGPIFV